MQAPTNRQTELRQPTELRWLPEDYVAPVDAPKPNDLIDWWAPAGEAKSCTA